jgi:anti-sigma28 factor (negative regulator of flagellin synthesis)
MAINPVDFTTTLEVSNGIKKKTNLPAENEIQSVQNTGDKVELSPEAKKIHESQVQSRLSEIRSKIEEGFYNSDEVLSSVANSLIKVIRNG